MTTLDAEAQSTVQAADHAARQSNRFRQVSPVWYFAPHDHGQIQAIASDATYRILIPGNGFGKTTTMAMDAEFLLQGIDPFKPHILPKGRPAVAAWFCMKYQQFELIRPLLEKVLTRTWKWDGQKHRYRWPNGAQLFILSSDSDWTAIQGIPLDAVYFDEHPGRGFWNEMLYRRRGEYLTRYMVAATMTQGLTWFIKEVIQPWEKYCMDKGLTLDQAMEAQPHPTTFCWLKGGIEDNPAMSRSDVEHYDSITTTCEAERGVRRRGGYADFTGRGVFDRGILDLLIARATAGEVGGFVFLPDSDVRLAERLPPRPRGTNLHRFWGAREPRFFRWVPDAPPEGGRITLFEPPDPGQAGNYVVGADFAAGLEGMDYDAAVVGLKTAQGPVRQVAEALGHWGDVAFAEVLYALCTVYFNAFLCGERQFGLPTMRRLYDEMGYSYQYAQRDDQRRSRRPSDLLGHHRFAGDTIIPRHQADLRGGSIVLVSPDCLEQHRHYQFRPRKQNVMIDDVRRSGDLTTGAPDGEFDDLVMAAAYMGHAAREVIHFQPPRPAYRPGSAGDILGLDEIHAGPAPRDPYRR